MASFVVDEPASRLVVRTKTTGVLARFAHDLEIACTPVRGEAEIDGDRWTATLVLRASAFEVIGVLESGKVSRGVLSADDRADIERRIRADAFASKPSFEVRARGQDRSRAEVTVALRREASFSAPLAVKCVDQSLEVTGACDLSLRALGVPEIKGPLHAFRVSDNVAVHFAIVLRRKDA